MPNIKQAGDLETLRQKIQKAHKKFPKTITICGGTGCQASKAGEVIEKIREVILKQGFGKDVYIRSTGCHGFCEQGPIMVFEPGNILYCHVTTEDIQEIVDKTIRHGEVIERLLYTDPVSGKKKM